MWQNSELRHSLPRLVFWSSLTESLTYAHLFIYCQITKKSNYFPSKQVIGLLLCGFTTFVAANVGSNLVQIMSMHFMNLNLNFKFYLL